MSNYNRLLTVQAPITSGTRVTSVTKKPYGYRIQLFNHYITLYYVKLIINPDKSARAQWLVKKNHHPDYRFTEYYGTDGNEITRAEYYTKRKFAGTNLIQYVHACSEAFHSYIKDEKLDVLAVSLLNIQNHCRRNSIDKDAHLWFRFFKGYTLATTINDLIRDLNSGVNREWMLDNLRESIKLENDLEVYYS